MLQFLHRDSRVLESSGNGGPTLVQVAFLGKGVPPAEPKNFGRVVGDLLPAGVEAAWVRQIHSADVVEARDAGTCGPADALLTRRAGLGLTVVTADCVPVLLAGRGSSEGNGQSNGQCNGHSVPQIAAVHAGWRGVAAGVVGQTVQRFAEPPLTAWIGPAISGEVYEVGPEVAEKVADASDASVVSVGSKTGDGSGGREHVDLRRAVEIQLRRLGVEDLRHVDRCTYRDESLWSYRRDGDGAGRNLAIVWMEP